VADHRVEIRLLVLDGLEVRRLHRTHVHEVEPLVHLENERRPLPAAGDHHAAHPPGHRRFNPEARAIRAVHALDPGAGARRQRPLVRRHDVVDFVFALARHAIDVPPEPFVQPEHHAREIRVAEENEDDFRVDAARDDPVLEREIPPHRSGTRLEERRRAHAAQLGKPDVVDARPRHGIADDDDAGVDVGKLFDGHGIECAADARAFESRQVARRRGRISVPGIHRTNGKRHRDRERREGQELKHTTGRWTPSRRF
jgi:hypothetical protein